MQPQVFVTYNGDFFDFPFIDERAAEYGMSMEEEIGMAPNNQGEYRGRTAVHMDAIYWVRRDSYLPAGSHGLKVQTTHTHTSWLPPSAVTGAPHFRLAHPTPPMSRQ